MKEDIKLDEIQIAPKSCLSLHTHDGDFSIRHNGQGLMHSRLHASESLIGELACEKLQSAKTPRILIGGLGLGFTLRAVLDNSPPTTQIDVYELVPEVIQWNETHMLKLNGHLLSHPQVHTYAEDVVRAMQQCKPETYDAIIFDIDNGPVAMVANANGQLYNTRGIKSMRRILKPQGRAAIWSAQEHAPFENAMRRGGFKIKRVPAKTHPNARSFTYQIYLGDIRNKFDY